MKSPMAISWLLKDIYQLQSNSYLSIFKDADLKVGM